jgi:transcriptional regulator of nitric oxide reductase
MDIRRPKRRSRKAGRYERDEEKCKRARQDLFVDMTPAAAVASVALVLDETWLVVKCWRQRSVLGAACGVVAIALVLIAIVSDGGSGAQELAGSLAALIIGLVLLWLGWAVQRLLDEEPDAGA